jgi:signal transduction histidine kinase/ActR/RegA family two-component response regulator
LSVSVSVLPLLSALRFSPGHILLVGLIYFGAARYGWILAAAPTGVTPFWPPAGIALALLLLWGRHVWPGILLGAIAADVSLGLSLPSILIDAAANTIETLTAATLLARWPGFDSRLERPRDLTALLLSAALATLIGAVIGTTGLWLAGITHPKTVMAFVTRLSTWWLGDMMGVLVLSPPLLIWGRTRLSWPRALPRPSTLRSPRWRRRIEAFLLCAALGLSSFLSFGPATPTPSVHSAVEYLPFPLIIWASMRFGVRGASAASLVLTASAVWHYSISPLERHQLGADANLLLLQTSIAVIVLTALVIGAVMTERDAVTRALDESRAKLQQKQHLESLGLLAGGVAHDFNNLLTGVLGSASLARQQILAMPRSNDGASGIARHPASIHLREIENAAERAANLCRQMLAYAGQGRFQSQPLDLSAVVRDEIGALSRGMSAHITMTSDLPAHLPAVDADAIQLRQMVTNLLLNASEAIKGDAGTIRVTTGLMIADRAHLATAHLAPELDAGRYVSLTIADTGHGMSADTLPRIFDPFFTTKFTGRGLGLAAVLGIVRSHRGALWVTSEPGAGTTFRVLLPATDAPAILPAAPVAPSVPKPSRSRASCLSLVVDDESSVRAVATRMLAACGLESLTASSGEEAVAVLEANPGAIVLVLLDLTMPEMNGEETYRRLRAIDRSVPVLLMSGYSEHEASTYFGGQGTSGFIQKPFRLDELKEAIRRVLRDDSA